jgi:hypothetical protein
MLLAPYEKASLERQTLCRTELHNHLPIHPVDQLGELDPAVVTREFPAKRQEEVVKRELVAMLTPIHMENVGRFADVITILDDHTITVEK